ncbi:hypothetical protein D3C72_2094080 [compost metagenome]
MWHIHAQGGIDRDQFFPQQIAIKATYTGEKSCGGPGFVVLFKTPGQVIENQLAPGIGQFQAFFLQPAVEQGQVAAIGIAGVIGKTFFQPQGIKELIYQWMIDGRHGHSSRVAFRLRTKLKWT